MTPTRTIPANRIPDYIRERGVAELRAMQDDPESVIGEDGSITIPRQRWREIRNMGLQPSGQDAEADLEAMGYDPKIEALRMKQGGCCGQGSE